MQRFAERVLDLLSQSGRTQAWLAHQAGLSPSIVSRVLRGEREATADVIKCLAGVFAVDVGQFVLGTDAEARVAASADWIPRADFVELVGKLTSYEARIHDLEDRVRRAHDAEARQTERRREAESALCAAHMELARAAADLADERAQRRSVDAELRRHRQALATAAARVTELQAQLAAVAGEVRNANRSSRLSVLLSGVAAAAGVVTVAHFLSREDDPEEGEDEGD